MSSVGRRRFFFLFSLFSPRLRQAEVRRFVLHLVLVCFIFCTQFFLRERWGRGECFPLCFWRGEERDRVWRNKKVQVEKEKKKPFFFPPSLVHSALPLRSPISSSPRGALLPRNRMRSAVALGRAAVAMPSCSRRASSAPAPARRVVAVKVNFELELLSRPLFRDAGEKRQRSCLSLRLRRRRHAGPLHKPSPPAHDHIEVSTLGGQPRQRSDRGSPRGGLCSLGSLPSTPPSRSTDAHDHEKKKRFLTSFPTSPRPAAWSRSARRTPPRSSRPPRPRARSTPSTPTSTPCR